MRFGPQPVRMRWDMRRLALAAGIAVAVLCAAADARAQLIAYAATAGETVVDGFEDLSAWTTSAPEGAEITLVPDTGSTGGGMRIDFDFHGRHGFVIARREISLDLPRNFVFFFNMRGKGPPNDVEFKLIDRTGKNVWRRVMHDVEFPDDWGRVRVRKARLGSGWGPDPELQPEQIGAIEIAITAAEGGKGSVWVDELRYEEREPTVAATTDGFHAKASTSHPEHGPDLVLDRDAATVWRSVPEPASQWLTIDLGRTREFGGLAIDWDKSDYAVGYEVQTSDDGDSWTAVHDVKRGNGGRDYVYLPDAEARYLRLALNADSRASGYAIAEITVKPPGFASSLNEFFQFIAAESAPGDYPKYFSSRQSYWTVIGAENDAHEALLNEEGAIEVDTESFSIEPFLYVDGELWTWSDVDSSQSLTDGHLPIPRVMWRRDDLELLVTAFAGGEPGRRTLYARYTLRNTGDSKHDAKLLLALRPFQVSPPWQSLNMAGGVSHIREVAYDGRRVRVNGDKMILPITPPDAFGAAAYEEGAITEFLRRNTIPAAQSAVDDFGFASGVLRYDALLEAGDVREFVLAVPWQHADGSGADLPPDEALRRVLAEQDKVAAAWRTVLDRVYVDVPPAAGNLADTIKATLAYILINRDGAAIQPGSRAYARSWIRDGALTSTALLQFGFSSEVRSFLQWYAPQQFSDGKVPCCVDRRGPDPTPEHDSNGELIYAVAEYYRFTRDVGLVHELWPRVQSAVDYIAALRSRRMREEYGRPENAAYFGLLPESISHEGYSAHPVHSYWDDFFALRGLKDATTLAVALGDEQRARDLSAFRDEFRSTLYASIGATMANHTIDFIPGSVELGDFDPTSTAIAITTAGELGLAPDRALRTTFRRYAQYVRERRRGEIGWDAYSAYELRNVQAMLRLGWKRRALGLLRWLLADQRPAAWRQWPEISWREKTSPRFIGDLPHTWVGSAFLSAARTVFVHERELDNALVVAAGVPRSWLRRPEGIEVRRLPTYWGAVSYKLRRTAPKREGAPRLQLDLAGDLQVPPGGIVIASPLKRPLREATVNGRPIADFTDDDAVIKEFPAHIVLTY